MMMLYRERHSSRSSVRRWASSAPMARCNGPSQEMADEHLGDSGGR